MLLGSFSPEICIWNEHHNLPSFSIALLCIYKYMYMYLWFFSQSLNSMFVPQLFSAKIVVTESESTIMLMLSFLVSCFCCIFCFGKLMMRYCFCRDTISRRGGKKINRLSQKVCRRAMIREKHLVPPNAKQARIDFIFLRVATRLNLYLLGDLNLNHFTKDLAFKFR